MNWWSSDFHIDHKRIILYCMRKFMTKAEHKALVEAQAISEDAVKRVYISDETVNRMNDAIFDNLNSMVAADDTFYYLGDMAFVREADALKRIRDRINCRNVIFITGNHDKQYLVEQVFETHSQLEVEVDGIKIFMRHIPDLDRRWTNPKHWHFFGHHHSNINNTILKERANEYLIDVGVDCNDFKPFSFDAIRNFMGQKIPQTEDPIQMIKQLRIEVAELRKEINFLHNKLG